MCCGDRRPKGAKARNGGKFDCAAGAMGFDGGAELDAGCDANKMRPAHRHSGEIGSVQQAFRQGLGTDQRVPRGSRAVAGWRGIVAGGGERIMVSCRAAGRLPVIESDQA